MTSTDAPVVPEDQHVTGQHVDPAQATPPSRPHRPLAVVGHWIRHLLNLHDVDSFGNA
jgi:hypothetical protein